LYSSPSIITIIKSRRMRWAGHVSRIGRRGIHIDYWCGKAEGNRPVRKPRRRWVDNIKMDLREIGYDGMDSIDLALDRDQWRALVNKVMNLRV
jgi:hypothetical protein